MQQKQLRWSIDHVKSLPAVEMVVDCPSGGGGTRLRVLAASVSVRKSVCALFGGGLRKFIAACSCSFASQKHVLCCG